MQVADWNFSSVSSYVAAAEQSRSYLDGQVVGALAMLSQYDEDEDGQ